MADLPRVPDAKTEAIRSAVGSLKIVFELNEIKSQSFLNYIRSFKIISLYHTINSRHTIIRSIKILKQIFDYSYSAKLKIINFFFIHHESRYAEVARNDYDLLI